MGKTVGLTYDLKTDYVLKPNEPLDANAELDNENTVSSIVFALEQFGNKVIRIGNANNLLKSLDNLNLDIVFNITEGWQGRNRESQVPILLEMKNIPFVGSDGLTLGLSLDKLLAKKLLISERIPTPHYIEARSIKDLDNLDHLKFPMIVKPRHEGSSKGLNDASRVENEKGLKAQVSCIIENYKQPALIEEFISGLEFTVAVIGNKNPEPLPIVQIKIDGTLEVNELFYTYDRIHSDKVEYICPAQISKKLSNKISDLAKRTYQAFECRDFGRVDFRVDKEGNPYVLEINPLPSLSREDVFTFIAKHLGTTYEAIINRILNFASERYGM